MVIVSQDRQNIINFNNVSTIGRNKNYIYVDFVNDSARLGIYATEERANEVLSEIIEKNARFEIFRVVPAVTQSEMIDKLTKAGTMFDTYVMPEE